VLQIGTTNYRYGMERLAAQSGSTRTWYGADALGSVRQTLDAAGVPQATTNYDPWGQVQSGSVPTFGFTGELHDGAAGLVNLRARWYNTRAGTFTAVDPFDGFAEQPYSQHPYQYAYANPVVWTDPSGQYVQDAISGRINQPKNPRDLTDWLYREMMANLDDSRLQFVKGSNQAGDASLLVGGVTIVAGCATANPLIAVAGGAVLVGAGGAYAVGAKQFYDLVADHKPWDFKHKIKERLGPVITLCANGKCKQDVEFSVPGNIHFGFVAKEAGYLGFQILAGAGLAEIGDPAHDPERAAEVGVEYQPYAGGFSISISLSGVDLNLGDDPVDTRAVAFGMRLYQKYGRSLSLSVFRQEISSVLPQLASFAPNQNPVSSTIADKWPYGVGYFDPTSP
jgi:RHS repeat-associated protein